MPLRESGRVRRRLPVAAEIALEMAGMAGGSAGSPRPVTGKLVMFHVAPPSVDFSRTKGMLIQVDL